MPQPSLHRARHSGVALLLAALLAPALAGCFAPVYEVHRAALVQPPAPPAWSGKLRGTGIALSNASLIWKSVPTQAPDSNSGLYVTTTQLEPTPHFQVGEHFALWLPFSYGFAQGSFAAAPCLVERPDRGVFTGGLGMALSAPVTDGWYMGISGELQVASIPSRIVAFCVDNCPSGSTLTEKVESENVAVGRLTALVGRDLDGLRVFGGLSLRNHPTNVRIEHEVVWLLDDIDAEVRSGPTYLMPGFGVELDLGENFGAIAQVFQPIPLSGEDLIYGPIASVGIDLHTR